MEIDHQARLLEIADLRRRGLYTEAQGLEHEQQALLLLDIRDELRNFVRLMQEPGPVPEHVHEPADGGSPQQPFWVCRCGYIFDDERKDG